MKIDKLNLKNIEKIKKLGAIPWEPESIAPPWEASGGQSPPVAAP